MKEKRFNNIDLLKCISMLFVIIYHGWLCSNNFLMNDNIINYFNYFFKGILSIGSPMFLLCNGYLLFGKELNLKKHTYKIMRYLIISIIWFILVYIFAFGIPQLSGKEFIENLFSFENKVYIHHFWFISSLVCIYVFFPLLKSVYENHEKYLIFFLIISVIINFGFPIIKFLISVIELNLDIKFEFDIAFLERFNPFNGLYGFSFVYFVLGGLVLKYEEKIKSKLSRRNWKIFFLILIFSLFMLMKLGEFYSKKDGNIWDSVWNGYDTIFTLINVLCVYFLTLNFSIDNFIIRIISKNTLGIYFIHVFVIVLTMNWAFESVLFGNIIGNIIYGLIVLFISTLISILLKRIPIFRKLV